MMGLETTVNFISDLNPLNPADGDLAKDGDNHIRLIKAAVKQTFPNITGAVTASHADLNTRLFPTGGIIFWSGSIGSIPLGWLLCDGTNGTPDLRDRFVVGAGSSYVVGATGGAGSVALAETHIPIHTHTVSGTTRCHSNDHSHSGNTGTAGAHSHNFTYGYRFAADGGYGTAYFGTPMAPVGGLGNTALRTQSDMIDVQGTHLHSFTTGGASVNHTHNFSAVSSAFGGSSAHENRPPYFALAYIMKA
jgi:microcystin-dependent protein